MLSHAYNILIYRGVGEHGNVKHVIYGLDVSGKIFISMLMATVKLPDTATNESQMVTQTSMSNKDTSLARQLKKHLSDTTHSHGSIDHGKTGTEIVSVNRWSAIIMFRTENTYSTNK